MNDSKCPDPEVLAAFVAGNLSDDEFTQVLGHLGNCDDCLVTVGEAARFNRPKGECPDDETLAAFTEGTLSDNRLDETISHVSHCSICRHIIYGVIGTQDSETDRRWYSSLAVLVGKVMTFLRKT